MDLSDKAIALLQTNTPPGVLIKGDNATVNDVNFENSGCSTCYSFSKNHFATDPFKSSSIFVHPYLVLYKLCY